MEEFFVWLDFFVNVTFFISNKIMLDLFINN